MAAGVAMVAAVGAMAVGGATEGAAEGVVGAMGREASDLLPASI